MSTSVKYSAVTAKIKTKLGNEITVKDYDVLVKLKNVNEIARYLKNETSYSNLMSDIDDRLVHRGQLETVIKKNIFVELLQLSTYMPPGSKDFIMSTLRQAEIEQIIDCVYYINNNISSEFILSVPTYLFEISKLDYKAMSNAKNYGDLTEVLKNSPYYQVLKSFNPSLEKMTGEFEAALYSSYYKQLYTNIQKLPGTEQKNCYDLIGSQIDFLNIVTIIRIKKRFNMPPEEIEKLIIPHGYKINKSLIYKMINCTDENQVYICLASSRYKNYFAKIENIEIDNFYYDHSYTNCRRILSYGKPSLNSVLAYINLKLIETKNLITIIESVRYSINPNNIISKIIGYDKMKKRSEIIEV